MNFSTLTLMQVRDMLVSGKVTSAALVEEYTKIVTEDNKSAEPLKGFIDLYEDAAAKAAACDAEIAEARKSGDAAVKALFEKKPLLGIPFGVKDNISVQGKACTCGSKILESYVSPYNATVIQRLIDAGAVPFGRTNMDEFAMGSSTEYSCYGASHNPVNRAYTPGGSSGGSAAVVAGGQVPFALGTETGGSVRLPAAYCGIYGYKPTYGTLSRWGVVAFGSSLDQVGLLGKEPADIALPLAVMAGEDFYDDTSADTDVTPCKDMLKSGKFEAASIKGLKIAIPKQFLETNGLDAEITARFEETKKWFVAQGATVETVEIPVLDAAIACYYVIALSEAASNLSRFDGIRYGARKDPGEGYDELYVKTRSEGFGAEVKRRIVIGNYVLSSNFSGDCYKKAMTVRARIQRDISEVFKKYDLILCPTSPTSAFKLGSKVDDPMAMYLSDLFTTFVNLARVPSVSVPAGLTKEGLPIGIQITGAHFKDAELLQVAQAWHEAHPEVASEIAKVAGSSK